MHHFSKKLLAAFSAAVLTAASVPASMCVSAAEKNILILGDSISAGNGLAAGESGYYDYLAASLSGTVTNLAQSGATTADLLAVLDNTANAAAISGADYICISIGSNDLMQPAKSYLGEFRREGEEMMDTVRRVAKEGDIQTIIAGLTRTLRTPRNTAKASYADIAAKIRALNPNAVVVMQTLYNPFEVPESYLDAHKFSEIDKQNFRDLLNYVSNNERQLNDAIKSVAAADPQHTKVADIMEAFAGGGWLFDRVLQKDIHPTALGHAAIAASILDAIGGNAAKTKMFGDMLDNLTLAECKYIPAATAKKMQKLSDSPDVLRGDVDGSGKVSNVDAQSVVTVYAAIVAGTDIESKTKYPYLRGADVNGDMQITAEDPQYILMYYVANYVANQPTGWDEIIAPAN